MVSFLIPLNILIPTTVVIAILIVILWILYSKNKKMYGKISSERGRFSLYERHMENLQNNPKTPQKDFKTLNQVARAFFKEYHNLNYSLTYLELADYFKKQGKKDLVDFCTLMSNLNYSGQEPSSEEIRQVVAIFSRIIKEH